MSYSTLSSGQRREFTLFRFFDALKLGGKGSHSNGGGGVYLRALSFEHPWIQGFGPNKKMTISTCRYEVNSYKVSLKVCILFRGQIRPLILGEAPQAGDGWKCM